MRHVRVLLLIAFTVLAAAGCASVGPKEPKFIDDIRAVPPPLKVVHYSIQRKDLQETLVKQSSHAIRIVPVFDNISVRQSYSYRLFDIQDDSAYALLGLQTSDIVVAADRYLIKRPEQFPTFVQLLAGMDEATIEIRRGGEARLFKYRFLPSLSTK